MTLYVYPDDLYDYAKNKNAFNLKSHDFKENVEHSIKAVWENGGVVRFKDVYMQMEVTVMPE